MNTKKPIYLGVNIDHVATVRQARGTTCYPKPVEAVLIAEQAGADGITLHLREDRRHIQDRDVYLIREVLQTRMNFEMALTDEMIAIAKKVKPTYCCFVPERRQEITTEGGLDVILQFEKIKSACHELLEENIQVSLFIDPSLEQVEYAAKSGAGLIEIHTGAYAEAKDEKKQQEEYERIKAAAKCGFELGLQVNAGHGLHYHNVQPIASILEITELNIGHSIIARAIMTGLHEAVFTMKRLMVDARRDCTESI